jgi:zinc transporter
MGIQPPRIEPVDLGPGIVWAFQFDGQGRARPLPSDSHAELVCDDGFVWLHLSLANARSRNWIDEQAGIPEPARELLLSKDDHPRIECDGDVLWGTVHDIHHDEGMGDRSTDIRFVLTPRYLLTGRRHAVRSANRMRERVEAGDEFESSAELFEHMLVAIADTVGASSREFNEQLDAIEDTVLSETVSDERAALLRLRRSISRQNRLVQAIRAILDQFQEPRFAKAPQAYRDLATRVGQRIASFQADFHLHADRARMLQDEMSAQIATGTNQNLFVLTIVTTILLPPAFVTGFFGMNTKGLPFADSEYGTLLAATFCVVAALLVYLVIRRYRMFN